MNKEFNILFTALSFFTRIPFPSFLKFKPEHQHEAIKYFPLSGIIIGSLSGLIFYLSNIFFSDNLSIILAMATSVLFTGALHEDGIMDVCDGFGGGWTKERILEIMKDSLIGAFGVTGLVFIVLIKFFALQNIAPLNIPIVLIGAHTISRYVAASIVNTHDYARVNMSKAKDYTHKLSWPNFVLMTIISLSIFFIFDSPLYLICLPICYLVKILVSAFFNKWIGGFTGDCIGAIQQICEIIFYLSFIVISQLIK